MTTEEAAKAAIRKVSDDIFKSRDMILIPRHSLEQILETTLRTALSASPWVSVKERMPTAEDGDECCEVLYRSVRGEAFVRSWSYAAVAPGVTHWMRVPELPQQEG